MKRTTYKQLQKKVEDCGWTFTKNGSILKLGNHSPLGEDISFKVDKKPSLDDTIAEIIRHCREFDEDHHAALQIGLRGDASVPDYVIDLVNDAVDIKAMLNELANQIEHKTSEKKEDPVDDFIRRFAHFMSEPNLDLAYDSHFKELRAMSASEIEKWLRDLLNK